MTRHDGRNHLLIAEDEPDIRRLVSKVATPEGWNVIECANGIQLLEAVPTLPLDAVLLIDIMMPELDGVEAIPELAKIAHGQPIYFLTGGMPVYAQIVRHLCKREGLNLQDVLAKPISVAAISAKHSAPNKG